MSHAAPPPVLEPTEEFLEQARAQGIAFEPGDLERLGRYLGLLLERNRQVNLTAITDPAAAWMRHILDSLALLPLLAEAQARRVIDIGSGGGLPGLPLAAVLPAVHFTLLEATAKKARFLEEACAALALSNTRVVNQRAESAGREPAHRERYDVAIARAVGRLRVLLELAVPLVRVGGMVLAIKGAAAPREIEEAGAALRLLHASVSGTRRTPTGTIVIIRKERVTPQRYPRRPGEPQRAPLGN